MPTKLTYPAFEKLMSAYLKEGFKEDIFNINTIEISDDNKRSLLASVDIVSYMQPLDGIFHLSALTNSRITQQLGVIYSCHLLNTEKDREIFLLKDYWQYKRSVTKLNDLKYEFNNILIRNNKKHIIVHCQINVGNGAFLGNSVWLIPNTPYEKFE